MRPRQSPCFVRLCLAVVPLLLLGANRLAAEMISDVPQVASRVFNGYTRTREADGTLKRETYAFGDGGRFDFEMQAGNDLAAVTFEKLARELKPVLARQGYVPATNPDSADLLILVLWGTTQGTTGKPPNYREVEKQNIQILGFQNDVDRARALSFTTSARDFLDELEAGRYFVVLKAYDFKTAWKEKRRKIMWETRFSIRRQASDFAEQLPAMAAYAAGTFGTETHGLVRPKDAPRGEVRLDDTKYGEAVEGEPVKTK